MLLLRNMSNTYKKPSLIAIFTLCTIGLLVAFLGLAVVIGWHLIKLNIIGSNGYITSMEYNSGLCFFLAGLSFVFRVINLRKTALLLAFCVIVIGTMELLEYNFQLDLNIDQYFIPSYDLISAHQGSMSSNNAFCFILVGIAIGIMSIPWDFKFQPIFIKILGALIISLNLVSLVMYFVGIEVSPGWTEPPELVPRTSVEFIIISIGIISLNIQHNPYPHPFSTHPDYTWCRIRFHLPLASNGWTRNTQFPKNEPWKSRACKNDHSNTYRK